MAENRRNLIGLLKESRTDLVALARSLSAAELQLATENPGWTVKDTLAHVASSESGLIAIAMRIVNKDTSARPGFDLHAHNQQQVEKRRDKTIEDLLAELRASREEALSTMASLTDEELSREGQFAGAPATAASVFGRIGHHELEHGGQVRRAISKG